MWVSKNKLMGIILVGILVWGNVSLGEAAQYFAQQYNFNAKGRLDNLLTVNFSAEENKIIKAVLSPIDEHRRMLLIAFPDGEDIFTSSYNNGYDYAIYKIKLRDREQEDLLILSYGKRGTGKTSLKSIAVIGENSLGLIEELPVQGFKETTVFNSPLQIRDKTAVLFKDMGRALITLSWDPSNETYQVEDSQQ